MILLLPLVLFFLTAVLAVFIPQAVPLVLIFVYRLLDLGVPFRCLFLMGAFAATSVTALLRYVDIRIHERITRKLSTGKTDKYIGKYIKQFHNRFHKTFAFTENKMVMLVGVMLGSMSIIPDIVLIEFARERLAFHHFIIAAGLGKCVTYAILIGGATGLISTVMV